MPKKARGFARSERIKKRFLFTGLFTEGRYFRNGDFSLRYLPNDLNIVRLGISIKKNDFRAASDRNRVKRLVREAFRRNKNGLVKGTDILIRPKNPALAQAKSNYAEKSLLGLFKEAGLISQQ